jgi:hypothetical protein
MTTSLLLVAADGASEAAQRVYRCGSDGSTGSQRPCKDGYEIDTDDRRSAGQRKAAAEVLKRDKMRADKMTRERLAKQAAAAEQTTVRSGPPKAAKPTASTASAASKKKRPPTEPAQS